MNWEKLKRHKWVKKVIEIFGQGLSPRALALSITAGVVVGVIPLFGVTTLSITTLALYFRLNLPVALFMTYAVGPIHLLLFIPFIKLGEMIFGANHTLLSLQAIRNAFRSDYVLAIKQLAFEMLCGITGWLFVAIPVGLVLFIVLWKIFAFSKLHKERHLRID